MSTKSSLRGLASSLRPRLSLSQEGVYYIILIGTVLAGAIARQVNLLILLFGVLLIPVLLSWRVVRGMIRKLQVERKLPPTLYAGDLLTVEIEVKNQQRKVPSWSVTVADALVREFPRATREPALARILFGYIPAGGVQRGVYRGRIAERGRYRFGPMRLSTSFPLGLLRYTLPLAKTQTLVVYPRLGRLGPGLTRFIQWSELGHESVKNRQGAQGTDFYGLREWQHGDSRRLIHWRTSARRQNLYIRQFEQPRKPDLALVIELWQPERPSELDLERVEQVLSLAASVVTDVARRGSRRLYLGTAARQSRYDEGPASPLFVQEVLESLSVAEASASDHLPEILARTLDSVRPDARIVVVSTRGIDLGDRHRFGALRAGGRHRSLLTKAQCLDASSASFSEYFTMSEAETAAETNGVR